MAKSGSVASVGLTAALLITAVFAVVVAIAYGPERHTAVVGLAVKLGVVVTSIRRAHFVRKVFRKRHTGAAYKEGGSNITYCTPREAHRNCPRSHHQYHISNFGGCSVHCGI